MNTKIQAFKIKRKTIFKFKSGGNVKEATTDPTTITIITLPTYSKTCPAGK